MKYCINGKFLTERITGMQRYAIEMTNELDKISAPGEFSIVVPHSINNIPAYKNITIVKYGKLKGIPWEQLCLPIYLYKNKLIGIHMLANAPILKSGDVVVAHGVNNKVNPQFYKTTRDKIARLWHNIVYHLYFRHSHLIFTDTEFSKSEIIRTYHVKEAYLHIVPCAWQHMDRVKSDESIFDRHPEIQKNGYYFSMSSVNENKNFKWIAAVAVKNNDETFAIAGGRSLQQYFDVNGIKKPNNLHFMGYVSDGEAKALMLNCKAFLFPTFYEGFGMPPIEAMSCGAQAIVSDTSTMHEVYGDTVHYINPYSSDVELGDILRKKTQPISETLKKYSWEESAKKFYYEVMNRKL